jgi:uncharacterized phiE125 gp8 family phage protein
MGWRVSTEPTIEPLTLAEVKRHLRIDPDSGSNLSPNTDGPAVDKGGGLVGIPVTGHGLTDLEWITIERSTNYNGDFRIDASSSANEIVIADTFVAETFDGNELITTPAAADDEVLVGMIKSARQWCEIYQRRAYIQQSCTWTLDDWQTEFEPIRPPLISVTTIDSVYTVDTESEPGRIYEAYNQQWPTIRGDRNSIEIIYKAGYGTAASDVPQNVKQAMLLLIGHWYENREPVIVGTIIRNMPLAVQSLLMQDRVF